MKRINLPEFGRIYADIFGRIFYNAYIHDFYTEEISDLQAAEEAMQELLASEEFRPIDSREKADRFLETIRTYMKEFDRDDAPEDPDTLYDQHQPFVEKMLEAGSAFQKAFEIELTDMLTYLLPEQGLFNVRNLMNAKEHVYDKETRWKLTDLSLEDIQAAGKCLSFELPTACGFHILRATESVVKQYLKHLGATDEQVAQMKSWNDFANGIVPRGGSASIARVIQMKREFDRNPIMHPERTLDLVEANTLFATCQMLILSILKELP